MRAALPQSEAGAKSLGSIGMAPSGNSLTSRIVQWASHLRFPVLFMIIGGLFLIDFVTPDPIPLVDELILGLLAVLLGRWKDRRNVIETREASELE